MQRDTWNDLAVLAAIGEGGSFTGAARLLGVTPSAVSHAMRRLEARLGVRLLNRSTRSVAPTAAGRQLLDALVRSQGGLDTALAAIGEARDRPAGPVRITAHRTAALYTLLPRMRRFGEDHPEVSVEISVDDGLVDIVAAGFDAGVRRTEVLEPDMISVRLDDGVRLAYVAASAYLAAAGMPRVPGDLLGHRCIAYRFVGSAALHRWPFEQGGETMLVEVPAMLIVNDVDMLLEAALAGCGIACVTEDQARPHLAAGRLTRVLEALSPRLPPNYLYYAGRRLVPAPLRALIDALRV